MISARAWTAVLFWLVFADAAVAADPSTEGKISPSLGELVESVHVGMVFEEAAGNSPRPAVSPQGLYLQSAERRFLRGAANIATFPVDTFVCPADTAMAFARKPRLAVALYTPFSAVQGAGRSVLRLMSGIVDVVTCLVPRFEPLEPPPSYHCRTP